MEVVGDGDKLIKPVCCVVCSRMSTYQMGSFR